MAISVNDSISTERALVFAKLSELAYATWVLDNGQYVLKTNQYDYAHYESIWQNLSSQGYSVIAFVDDVFSGYSGTIFQLGSEKILANRGSEIIAKPDLNDIYAYSLIGSPNSQTHQIHAEQFRCMAEFINSKIQEGTFEVTGHSLGGYLAQIAKAAYSNRVSNVYTYGAP